MVGKYEIFGKSANKFLKSEAARLEISVPELLRRIVDAYRGELKPVNIDIETMQQKSVDTNMEMAHVFIDTLKHGLESGKIYLQQGSKPGDA